MHPQFLVCDEAVAALYVSIQAQVLNLFMKLRHQLYLTYLFISYDLGVVRHLSDRAVIMYLGRLVESAPADEVFARPNHPYTQALLASAPRLEVKKIKFLAVKGEIPSPLQPPTGCHPRCPRAMTRRKEEKPALREIASAHYWPVTSMDNAGAARPLVRPVGRFKVVFSTPRCFFEQALG